MGAVTYPDLKVVEFVNEALVPLQLQADSDLAEDFTVRWTPTLIILDQNGKEHSRTVGYIAPEEFVPAMLLGMAKMHFDLRQFDSMAQCLEKIINVYPWSLAAPEAIYYHGVCGYKTTHNAEPLKLAYERIAREYPYSEWVKRALPYRLL
ncbi:MAG TPA: thioredoxin fold domain-containing protein [Syntrophorhabdus sp.]|jgi:TolA-binding protein|nr:thioredoxin fold domain-containing protein [Syntrophorhabdus sp.]HNS77888.1 thioredoxin fold domain-containing protein [Syntrophorhabdus sp.]HNY69921.1 thioredoxin fold domain-containing protein [Syntrophorhabdus sp.]HPM45363.1 thioredoxin fold domain-containing protein [Caldisericia bacterium]HQB34277.1 thioredoxin fold domain-containing protein [Syntrophorhabdus sp.]